MAELDYKLTRWFEERPWIWKSIGWLFAVLWIGAIIVGMVWQFSS